MEMTKSGFKLYNSFAVTFVQVMKAAAAKIMQRITDIDNIAYAVPLIRVARRQAQASATMVM